jgi:hypothetical protein
MIPNNQTDALRQQVLARLEELRTSVAAYTQSARQPAQFILGEGMRGITIPAAKLAHCRVLPNREAIIQDMPDRGNVVELGTQTGSFARFILSQCPNITLFAIDIDYSHFAYDSLQPFIASGRLRLIEGSSWDELAKFPKNFFSWIYIDASHFLDNVRRDLAVARSRVSIGGHLICNDYTVWSPFEATPYGVLPAVNECVTQYDFDVTHLALHPFGYHDIALCRRS